MATLNCPKCGQLYYVPMGHDCPEQPVVSTSGFNRVVAELERLKKIEAAAKELYSQDDRRIADMNERTYKAWRELQLLFGGFSQ